jgi:CBS domain-containing protein
MQINAIFLTALIDFFARRRLVIPPSRKGSCIMVGALSRPIWLKMLLKRWIKDWQSLSLQKTTGNGFSGVHASGRTRMEVGDFMTTQVVTIHPDSPVRDAARLMLERKISGLPVVSASDHVVGIVTEHDLLRRLTDRPGSKPPHWLQLMTEPAEITTESARFLEAKVEEVMTRHPLTIMENTPIETACCLIEKRGIKRLPVVRDDRLVGIVARADLVRALGIAVERISCSNERAERAEALTASLQMESIRHRSRWPG